VDENFISLKLPDDWEEYRPREINLDTLTIWLGHKNTYPHFWHSRRTTLIPKRIYSIHEVPDTITELT